MKIWKLWIGSDSDFLSPEMITLRIQTPAIDNHQGAKQFAQDIEKYLKKEIRMGATMGPFTVPPYISRIGISPLSMRPKRNSTERRVILDLSSPDSASVNCAINKTITVESLSN